MKDLFGNHIDQEAKSLEQEYKEYINSATWGAIRKVKLKQAGYKCERCGISKWSEKLEVHHRTYDRFKRERMGDVEVLCHKCHKLADLERQYQADEKRIEAFGSSAVVKGFENWMDNSKARDWRDWDDEKLEKRWCAFLKELGRKNGKEYNIPFRRIKRWEQTYYKGWTPVE